MFYYAFTLLSDAAVRLGRFRIMHLHYYGLLTEFHPITCYILTTCHITLRAFLNRSVSITSKLNSFIFMKFTRRRR
jgi:hypothetical protein